ncbi:zinc finger protein-domain-containing protein [Aspergillus bertholletiae]|uniref:Zinc finger protein-domain-containing protein n=1 Tax=Aspergillus bertholletiae TaxID=1226010 RepID=A0A5N7ARX0_9EURO|nr:zinc finger protein-domain-containing protein [Aspergillus bertholletiae]
MSTKKDSEDYCRIGSGFCGTVWARNHDDRAIKREDGGPSRSLANDFVMYNRALDSLLKLSATKSSKQGQTIKPQVRIPKCYAFLTPQDTWWEANLTRFPAFLVGQYCPPPNIADEILSSVSNRTCLIRPYIGRTRTYGTAADVRSRFRGFSLQNFPLHLIQMVQLGIPSNDIECSTAMMGEALATLRWLGEIDGNDVEFVLAPPPTRDDDCTAVILNVLGEHTLWILDFDLCHSISMDMEGVRQAVHAFCRSDPFYPRPLTAPWTAFRREYLRTSKNLILNFHRDEAESRLDLANQFIELLETQKT